MSQIRRNLGTNTQVTSTTPIADDNATTQLNTCVSARQVSWWSVHEYVAPVLARVGEHPTIGTPAWCALRDDDPRKVAAVFNAAQHWSLQLEMNQEAKAEASRAISAAADWPAVASEIQQRNSFRADRERRVS